VKIDVQRRIAASLLGVGYHRVWIDPKRIEDVQSAITRDDIEALVKDGVIRVRPVKGISRARVERRKRGAGSVKGSLKSRMDEGQMWIARIRALRRELKILRERRIITKSTYRYLYRLAKGYTFRSVRDLRNYIYSHGLARRLPV